MAISRLRGVELPWDSQPQELTDLSAALGLVSTAVVAGPLRSVGAYQATNTGAANVASTGFEAIRLTGSAGRMQAPARAGTTPWTLLAYGIWRASSASAVMTLAEAPGNSTYDRSLHISSTGVVCGYVFDGAGKESISSTSLSVGVPALVAVVCTGSTMTSYIDGIAGTPTAVSNAGFNGYTTPELVFGYGGGLGGGGTGGLATLASSFDAAYAIKLDLAATEALLRELAARPWAAFEQRRIWVPMVSAGGGSTSLTVNETAHAHSADALTLTTSAVLTIADSTHAHAAESPAPSSSLGLTIAEALHGHAADSLTLSVTGSESLVTADATHGHAADSLALSSDTGLTVADALHGHAADNLTLDTTGAATLTTQDATHAHAVDAPMLYTDWLLAVAEATHGHAADNVSLSDAPELAPQDATHGHTADVLALSADTWLTIQQATQAQAADRKSVV